MPDSVSVVTPLPSDSPTPTTSKGRGMFTSNSEVVLDVASFCSCHHCWSKHWSNSCLSNIRGYHCLGFAHLQEETLQYCCSKWYQFAEMIQYNYESMF